MAGSIKKIQSLVNFPKSKYDNQIYFHVGADGSQIDMRASYVELEMSLANLATYRNVVLGQDGMFYNASCLFRDAKLTESRSGKYIADNLYVNILSNNLEYYSKGCNNVVADALFDGKGHASGTNEIVSVFNNRYADSPSAVIRCPLSLLYPGSVGQSDLFPQEDDLTFRYLMEPQFRCFMRAVKANQYVSNHSELPVDVNDLPIDRDNCGDIPAGSAEVDPTALGVVGTFTVGDRVLIAGTLNGVSKVFERTVTAITADAPPAIGHMTINAPIDVTDALENVFIVQLIPYDTNNTINATDLTATGNVLTLTANTPVDTDIYTNTTLLVKYTEFTPTGVQELITLETTVTNLGITGSNITSITLANSITLPAGSIAANISLQPLYTNLTNDWSLDNAHLILYRRKIQMAHQSKMLVSNFSSVNMSMVGGLNRFQYSLKAPNNTYNCYVFTPDATNLFSTAGGLQDYLISVNDIPLTSIYVNSNNSAVHKDNLNRVFGNSPYYQPKSLVGNRDKEIVNGFEPTMFVGKVFHSLKKGDPQVLPFDEPDRNIKIELVAADGSTTPTRNMYVFLEKWSSV